MLRLDPSLSGALALLAMGAALVPAPAAAQRGKDLRDVVTRTDGSQVTGRVVTPFATDEVLLVQGGRRVRIPRDRVAGMELVDDLVAEFSRNQRQAGDRVDAHFALAEWAQKVGLEALASVQAEYVLTLEPAHAPAHEFLGHREHPRRGWLWPDDRNWRTRDELDAAHASWGKARTRESEHFRVVTNAGVAVATTTLLDLEHLYTVLRDEFGAEFGWRTAIEPVEIHVWSTDRDFPALAGECRPYYRPQPFGDFGATWVPGPGERPAELWTTATQAILYRSVADSPSLPTPVSRLCASLELGFARWMESRCIGPLGRATTREPGFEVWQAEFAQNIRRYDLPNLLHLGITPHFYGGLAGDPAVHWASAQCFVTFLLDPNAKPPRRDALIGWMRRALVDGQGDSSSAFDDAFGAKIETLEEPFRTWLDVTGRAPRRR